MIKWTLWQFKNNVDSFLNNCSKEMQEVLMRRLDLLSEKGIDCKRPISAPLGDELFELRGQAGNKQARLIYYFGNNKRIIFINAFYKSKSQISRHHIETAKRNKKIIEEGKEQAHGFDLTH
jgi:hypothetical protein